MCYKFPYFHKSGGGGGGYTLAYLAPQVPYMLAYPTRGPNALAYIARGQNNRGGGGGGGGGGYAGTPVHTF